MTPEWGEHPIGVFSKPDIFQVMQPIRLTDYLAAIPNVHGVGLVDPNQQPGAKLFLKLPKILAAKQNFFQALLQHALADFSLIAMVFTTVLVVATVVLNWSR